MTLTKKPEGELTFRKPTKDDGADVWKLVRETGVLDLNSSYSYLMWCEIFSDTSIVVERDEQIAGFISGLIQPKETDTLFVWQVAVSESERGNGLATRMLYELMKRETCSEVDYVAATVSPSNIASQHLFKGLAKKLSTKCVIHDYFIASDFPHEGHEDERLFTIGPIQKEKIKVEG